MRRRNMRVASYTVTFVFGSVTVAHADPGIPMIVLTLPLMVCTLVPVVAVESFIFARKTRLPVVTAVKVVGIANAASTLLGIPLTWLVLVIASALTGGGRNFGLDTMRGRFLSVTWQAPWMFPLDADQMWLIPAAMLVLLIPFFFAAWFSETWIARLLLRQHAGLEIRRGMFLANAASYLMLGAGVFIWFLIGAKQAA